MQCKEKQLPTQEMRLKPCKMPPKNATDIRQMAKVRHLPFPLQNHPETVEFTFLTLTDPAHLAKYLKEEMEDLIRQQGFLLGSSFPKAKCGRQLCSQEVRTGDFSRREPSLPVREQTSLCLLSPFIRVEKKWQENGTWSNCKTRADIVPSHRRGTAFPRDTCAVYFWKITARDREFVTSPPRPLLICSHHWKSSS